MFLGFQVDYVIVGGERHVKLSMSDYIRSTVEAVQELFPELVGCDTLATQEVRLGTGEKVQIDRGR